MLFFGHIGITTGIVKACQDLVTARKNVPGGTGLHLLPGRTSSVSRALNDIQDKLRAVDYRFLLLGSLLPDIIDKPMWMLTSSSFPWSGRAYAHSLLLNLILLSVGLSLSSLRHKNWLFTIAAGSMFHLVFDQMWLDPIALWWPIFGPIHHSVTSGWFSDLWTGFLSDPYTSISEVAGFLITAYIALRLLLSGRIRHFLKTGDINWDRPLTLTGDPEREKVK